MQLSEHAKIRSQQRVIPNDYIEMILEYGTYIKKPGSALEIKIKKKDKENIIKHLKRLIYLIEKCSKKGLLIDENMKTILTLYNLS